MPVLLLTLLVALTPVTTDPADGITRTLRVAPGVRVMVSATVGDITIAGWDRPEVEIAIARRAPSSDRLADISTAIDAGAEAVRITVVQRDGLRDARLRGSVTIHAPFDQAFGDVELFEGAISLRDLRGGIRAKVDRGSIDATALSGAIRLETGIGDVRLDRAELTNRGAIRLRTFNGNVALGFDGTPADARILALSLGGTIQSEIPLTFKAQFGPRFGEATLGRGDRVVSIDVVRGDIRIARGDI
ncbi:MAG: hypothetical protein LAO77_07620 [Acidobacteriia bacterium]|nr:hypothetical protein [Terriglobia bacterium]